MATIQELEANYKRVQAQHDEVSQQLTQLRNRSRTLFSLYGFENDAQKKSEMEEEMDQLEEQEKVLSRKATKLAKEALEAVNAWKKAEANG